jgi:hypothetical protein
MDLGKHTIEELRQQKFAERAAAAGKAEEHAQEGYGRTQKVVWSVLHIFRYCWLNVFSIIALVGGVVFITVVPQTGEILINLAQEGQRERLLLAVLAIWSVSIWYTMRVLSTTDFPGEDEAHPAAKRIAAWMNREMPRVAPFAGLVIIACASAVFMREKPAPAWVPILASGVLPLVWAVSWAGDRLAGRWVALEPLPVYSRTTLGVAVAALAIGGAVWWSVPAELRATQERWHVEWLTYIGVALTLVPLALRRTGAKSHWLMAAAFVLWLWATAATQRDHPGSLLPLEILAAAALGLWLAVRRRELFGIAEDPATPHRKMGAKTFVALGVALAFQIVLVIAFARDPITLGIALGTLPILFLGLSLCAFFGIVWVFAPKYVTLPSLALVPLIWGFALGNAPDHSLRGTQFEASEAPNPAARPPLQQHFAAWHATLPKERTDNPVFFVAAAGGGLRAAYWTAHVLAQADDATCGEFGRHVYAYSGVSGGSLGIAAYLAQRQVWEAKDPAERCKRERADEMHRMLNRDFLAPVAGALLFAEMTQRFSPYTYLDDDRGSTLARSWARAWDHVFSNAKGSFDRAFLEQFAAFAPDDKSMPVRPAVFLNATSVESGRRALAANVVVRIPGAIDIFRPVSGVALKTAGLTLREAVLNSARFTYVSPAATVFGCPVKKLGADGKCPDKAVFLWGRLVDGGYYENSGLATLMDLVQALGPSEGATAPGLRKQRMQIVVIDNAADNEPVCRRRSGGDAEDFDQAELPANVDPFSGVTAPVEAFLRVREARAGAEVRRARREFRCRSQLIDWDLFAPRGDPNEAQKQQKRAEEAQHEPALGWFLSRRSAVSMTEQGRKVAEEFPFRHAVCDDGKLPKTVRVLVGERTLYLKCVNAMKP